MTGFVYAVGSEKGTVKIGYSVNPKSRLPFLRVGHPGKLTLLGFVEATRSQEAEVHKLLSRWRITGEWFRLEGAVKDFVGMLPRPPEPPKSKGDGKHYANAIVDWQGDRFRQADWCECCGLPPTSCLSLRREHALKSD